MFSVTDVLDLLFVVERFHRQRLPCLTWQIPSTHLDYLLRKSVPVANLQRAPWSFICISSGIAHIFLWIRPLYTVSGGISTKQTRDCCVYHWFFSGGLSFAFTKVQMIPVINHLINLINRLQLNFWWNPLHLFTWSAIQWVWYLHASTEQWEPLGVWLTASYPVKKQA